MPTVKHLRFKNTRSVELDYLLFLPRGYSAKARRRWPLIVFLHGAGERGADVWKAATHGPPKKITENPKFPFIIVSPLCPEGQVWSNDMLLALLAEITLRWAVDTKRVYLTGLSMGGYGGWSLGLICPEKFAAIAPVCGGGQLISLILSSREKPQALQTLGVWAFHGAEDSVVPLAESQRMVKALEQAGLRDVKLTVYPGVGHDCWTRTYQDPALYDWFLARERKPGPPRARPKLRRNNR